MSNNNIESFINYLETTNTIFLNIVQVIASQQNTYSSLINDRNIYTDHYTSMNNINRNISRNMQYQTLLRNLILRNDSLANRENNIPTEEQIRNSTRRTTFEEIENPINSSCPITQIDFSNNDIVLQINHCRHIFYEAPLLEWFNRNHCCPMCRYSIISDFSNENNLNQRNNINRNNNENISRNRNTSSININNSDSNIATNNTSRINRNNSEPNITRNNSFNRVPIITRINSNLNRINNTNNIISNDMLNQLQTIIDSFNNEIDFEVALITPSE